MASGRGEYSPRRRARISGADAYWARRAPKDVPRHASVMLSPTRTRSEVAFAASAASASASARHCAEPATGETRVGSTSRTAGTRAARVTHVPFVRGIGASSAPFADPSSTASSVETSSPSREVSRSNASARAALASDASSDSALDSRSARLESSASPEPFGMDGALAAPRCSFPEDDGPSSAISRVRVPATPGPPATEPNIKHISRNETVAHVHTRRRSSRSRGRGGWAASRPRRRRRARRARRRSAPLPPGRRSSSSRPPADQRREGEPPRPRWWHSSRGGPARAGGPYRWTPSQCDEARTRQTSRNIVAVFAARQQVIMTDQYDKLSETNATFF